MAGEVDTRLCQVLQTCAARRTSETGRARMMPSASSGVLKTVLAAVACCSPDVDSSVVAEVAAILLDRKDIDGEVRWFR